MATGLGQRALRWVAVLALVGGMAACSGGASDSSADADLGTEGGMVAEEGAPAADSTVTDADRQVIVTGSLTVVVDDALEAADSAAQIVEAAGGRVDERSEQAPVADQPASAYLTVRIPAGVLTDTLDELRELGEARHLSLTRQDVTLEVTDLDARIQALEVSIDRLQALMSQAGSVADLLAAENALTERQAELDSLRAQRSYLAEQVALSTIYLSLLPEATTPEPAPGGFWGGVQTGWAALVTFFNRVVVVLGILLPWVALAGIVLGIVFLVLRRRPKPRPAAPPRPHYPGAYSPQAQPGPRQPASPPVSTQSPGQQPPGQQPPA